MKVLLDSSFLLPFIQVEPENISSQQLKELLNRQEHMFIYSELSLFELVAKGMKICYGSGLTIEEVHEGIDSLIYRSPLQPANWIGHPQIIEVAYKIRKFHSDTIDCLIFATALYLSDCFATADSTLLEKIKEQTTLFNEVLAINPRFALWFDDLQQSPINLSEY
jgi:PIN domain nuclease of toxin-antitoxin system